jgi:hypothetical protein
MKKTPCLYAIARFTPFVETGEFANVGVVMIAPEERHFEYKLLIQRHARVTHFFEQLEPRVYKAAMRNLRDELERATKLLKQRGFDRRRRVNDVDFARAFFAEITRPRETVIKFAEPRAVLAENVEAKLEELYGFYVERAFVTREYQEQVLERGLRKWLFQARLAERFTRLELGDDEYQVVFPFVERRGDNEYKAIKPLHLAHDEPTKIIEHGALWVTRVAQLRKRQRLPHRVLFPVQGPDTGDTRTRAFDEATANLEDVGVTVLPYGDKEQVLAFAASA